MHRSNHRSRQPETHSRFAIWRTGRASVAKTCRPALAIALVFIASLALFLWVNVETGIVRSLLYNVIFIAGVSSLLFNGNPLLRYDAYYILSDLVEIPNLGQRANAYLGYLVRRYAWGVRNCGQAMGASCTAARAEYACVWPT